MAKNNKERFDKTARKTGFSIETGFLPIAFAFDDLSAGQLPYTCVYNSNHWLQQNFGACLTLFKIDTAVPCISPDFPQYDIKDAQLYYGNLIATSSKTAMEIKDCTRAKRYFYINDLDWIRPNFKLNKATIEEILNDKTIVKFTRCKDYYDLLIKHGYIVNPSIVTDFDINTILRIING